MSERNLRDLAQPLRDLSRWNRLLYYPPDRVSGYLSFSASAHEVWEALAGGEGIAFADRRLAVREDWQSPSPVILDPAQVRARVKRLQGYVTDLAEESGVSPLYLGLGLVFWEHAEAALPGVWSAPLLLCPVEIGGTGEDPEIRRVGVPELNPVLIDRLGIDPTGLPDDPLRWRAEDLADCGVRDIAPLALVGLFDLARYRLWQRLDVEVDPDLGRHPLVLRLLAGGAEPWPQAAVRKPATSTLLSMTVDRVQAHLVESSRSGVNLALQGGPGTGKTQAIAHVLGNAIQDGRTVLFLSGRASAFRAAAARLAETGFAARCLPVYGAECVPDRLAVSLGVDPGQTVVETLSRLESRPAVVMATPASYAMHVPADWAFDLLVVDEASLVPMVDGLPAIAACDQVVICGDSQQMEKDPPLWQLFGLDRPYVPQPSLIDAAVAAGMPVMTLTHHYRSRHPSLMQITNRITYAGLMRISPSPFPDRTSAFVALQVAGAFDWASATNRVEAEAIVGEIARHAASGSRASLGVIAMTMQQRDLIRRLVAERDLDLSRITGGESLLIADYNGIQGEERDVILVGMTFGPRPGETAWPTSFGALSLPGGEKRLNVIMTRARERMLLVTSFPKAAIAASRAPAHANLFAYMACADRPFQDTPDPHEGVLATVFFENAWRAMNLGNAVGAFDPDLGEFLVAVYVTGDLDPLTERSEIAQYRNSGWRIHEMPRGRLADLAGDRAGQVELAHRLRRQYPSLLAA